MGDHRKREGIKKSSSCHMFLALRREKDNSDEYDAMSVFREIIRDEEKDLAILRAKCEAIGGVWRIYKTVNKRCFNKAFKLFQHRLIDDSEEYLHRIDSLWKNCLLKQESRAEKFFMIDFDGTEKEFEAFEEKMSANNINTERVVKSPNGYHIVTKPFKVETKGRSFKYEGHDVLKDGYYFVEIVSPDELENTIYVDKDIQGTSKYFPG